MKKILTLAFALLCMVSVFAASNVDIIIKTNSEKIEALIQEVSDTEIRYKKANNPNGPMFVIKTDDVSSILYANGEVQAIEHKAQPAQQPQQNYGGYGYGNNYGGFAGANGPMQRVGNDVFMVEGRRLEGRELLFFLQNNCPQAYTFRRSWQNCEVGGWCLFGIGVAFTLGIGLGCYGGYEWGPAGSAAYRTGIAFMAAGGAIVLSSIPMIACGNVFKKRVDEVFNQYCGRQQAFQPELKLTSGANGLGLAIAF